MKDLISRQAAIEVIDKYFDDLPIQGYYDMKKLIMNLPTIEPEREELNICVCKYYMPCGWCELKQTECGKYSAITYPRNYEPYMPNVTYTTGGAKYETD